MPSSSPSPAKRPSMAERSSSTHSLSSSGKQATAQHKTHRVTRHSRNLSHGKGLSKLGKINSTANMTADGRNHGRKKSGTVTPGHSPRTPVSPHIKRNSSHVSLPKNTSHGNLRKNQSAVALASARTSSTNLKKLGAPPSQKKQGEHKQGFFELGDQSSGEDEGEWEDSTTQSPELSRNHSKASTPLRSRTPNGDSPQRLAANTLANRDHLTSPPETDLKIANRSLPNLRKAVLTPADQKTADPALLHNPPRGTRAPPAMSTVSAQFQGTEPTRFPNKQLHQSGLSAEDSPRDHTIGATSTSGSQGVSHFLPSSSGTISRAQRSLRDDSDDESVAEFMAHYKPQAAEQNEDIKQTTKARLATVPSRTQQRLELQRREMMRAGATTPATPTTPGLGLSAGSSVSLHSRSASKVRMRSLPGDAKALQHDYELGTKQLTVVRRFRNPVVESLHRLQESSVLPSEMSSVSSIGNKSRPQSRRGPVGASTTPKSNLAQSPEDSRTTQLSRANSQSRGPRVQFQMSRQGSHDDIMTAQGSPGDTDDEQDGVSPEEALIRRIWESQVTFEADGVQSNSGQAFGDHSSRRYVQAT